MVRADTDFHLALFRFRACSRWSRSWRAASCTRTASVPVGALASPPDARRRRTRHVPILDALAATGRHRAAPGAGDHLDTIVERNQHDRIRHPEMADILRAMQQHARRPIRETLPIAYGAGNLFARNAAAWNVPLPPMESRDLTGSAACLPPAAAGRTVAPGVVVFVHGGGWTFGSPDTHDRFARLLAQHAGSPSSCPTTGWPPSIHARPRSTTCWRSSPALDALPELQGPLVLCGDSAGANIALATALATARRATRCRCSTAASRRSSTRPATASNGDGRFGLGTARMRWYWNNWQGPDADARAARCTPI